MLDLEEKRECDGGLVFKILNENNLRRFCDKPKEYKCDCKGAFQDLCADGIKRYFCLSTSYNHTK
jgi:hypothetical protein